MNTISIQDLKEAAKTLPPSPRIFGKLGRLLKDPDTGLIEITSLVNTDSSLTAQVIRLSNSPAYCGGNPVDNLDEAINRIGFRELYKLVGMAASSQVFAERNATYNVDGSLMWENSLAAGLVMEFLAKRVGLDDQEAYTLGLLRCMGKMVIDACAKNDPSYPSYPHDSEPPLINWEDNNFGINNPTVAGFILYDWNFPETTSATIQFQYEPENTDTDDPMPYMLNLSNSVVEMMGKGLRGEGDYFKLTDERMVKTGVTQKDLEEAREAIEETLEDIVNSVSN